MLSPSQGKRKQIATHTRTYPIVSPGWKIIDVAEQAKVVGIIPNVRPSSMVGSRMVFHVQQKSLTVVAVGGQQIEIVNYPLLQFASRFQPLDRKAILQQT